MSPTKKGQITPPDFLPDTQQQYAYYDQAGALRTGTDEFFPASTTRPSLVLMMLHALRLTPQSGQKVRRLVLALVKSRRSLIIWVVKSIRLSMIQALPNVLGNACSGLSTLPSRSSIQEMGPGVYLRQPCLTGYSSLQDQVRYCTTYATNWHQMGYCCNRTVSLSKKTAWSTDI